MKRITQSKILSEKNHAVEWGVFKKPLKRRKEFNLGVKDRKRGFKTY